MGTELNATSMIKKIDILEQELIRLKRDILHGTIIKKKPAKLEYSLFGSVKGGDVTEEMIEESKRSLFRDLSDV